MTGYWTNKKPILNSGFVRCSGLIRRTAQKKVERKNSKNSFFPYKATKLFNRFSLNFSVCRLFSQTQDKLLSFSTGSKKNALRSEIKQYKILFSGRYLYYIFSSKLFLDNKNST